MAEKVFVGFGFGPIQAGLFVNEACRSKKFSRLVVAEVDPELIRAVRGNGGSYNLNVARRDRIEVLKLEHLEILDPRHGQDRKNLLQALREATEIATCLPAVKFYDSGENSAAALLAEGIRESETRQKLIYTAENNNRAAEILRAGIAEKIPAETLSRVQFLNTVIGKMSGVVSSAEEIQKLGLAPIAASFDRAFLVEEFNRIMVSRINLPGFQPGLDAFVEKDDLLPFEEAKLYGHNAVHALLAYLAACKGYTKIAEAKFDSAIMNVCEEAFLRESGQALIKKYSRLRDELFTPDGYRRYAEDLLDRMTNPFLADTVDRAGRDPRRKLGVNDRIFGTMALALAQGIEPKNMALGAVAGIAQLLRNPEANGLPAELRYKSWHKLDDTKIEKILTWLWSSSAAPPRRELISYVQKAKPQLEKLLAG